MVYLPATLLCIWQYVRRFSSDTGTLWTDRQTDRVAISISRVNVLTRDKNNRNHHGCLRHRTVIVLNVNMENYSQYSIDKSHTNHTLAGWCKLYSLVVSDKRLTQTKQKSHERIEVFSTVARAAPSFTGVASPSLLHDGLPFLPRLSSNINFFFLIIVIIRPAVNKKSVTRKFV